MKTLMTMSRGMCIHESMHFHLLFSSHKRQFRACKNNKKSFNVELVHF